MAKVPGVFSLAALTIASVAVSSPRAAATPVSWEYDLTVHGTAYGTLEDFEKSTNPITIPNGTPLTVDVTFDTSSHNNCGSNPLVADYNLGDLAGNPVDVHFLGYDYTARGHLEIDSTMSGCTAPGLDTGLRLWVDDVDSVVPAPTAESLDSTLIAWFPLPDGDLFLEAPPSDWLGPAYPSGLSPQLSSCCGDLEYGITPHLTIDSVDIRPIPEPTSATLIGLGALVGAIRQKQRALRKLRERTGRLD